MNNTLNPSEATSFFEEAAAALRGSADAQSSTVLQALKRLGDALDAIENALCGANVLAESLLDGMKDEPHEILASATLSISYAETQLFAASSKVSSTMAALVFGGQA